MSRWGGRELREGYPGPGQDLPVFYNDLDPNGHLNNVALGRFFEHARVRTNQATGLWDALKPGHLIVARVAIDYLSEGRFGPPLHLRTRIARMGRTSFTMEQGAWQGEGCTGLAEITLVNLLDGAPSPLPDAFTSLARTLYPALRGPEV